MFHKLAFRDASCREAQFSTLCQHTPKFTRVHNSMPGTPEYTTAQYDTRQHTTLHYSTPQYSTVHHTSVKYTTMQPGQCSTLDRGKAPPAQAGTHDFWTAGDNPIWGVRWGGGQGFTGWGRCKGGENTVLGRGKSVLNMECGQGDGRSRWCSAWVNKVSVRRLIKGRGKRRRGD